jgi:hypothetical protein
MRIGAPGLAPRVHVGRPMLRRLLAIALLASACDPGEGPSDDGRDDAFFGGGKGDGGLSAQEIAAVLQLANTADLDELDHAAQLDARAASGIVAHRSGGDGIDGTDDDDPFDDLAELDAVPWVGPTALERMLAHAEAEGLLGGDACLLVSEYFEGKMAYNKALEVYNCGDAPIALRDYAVCLVRNDDTDCTITQSFGDVELASGDVWVACRSKRQHLSDPTPLLSSRCDEELGSVMINSGDDRMALLHAPNGEDSIETGRVMDVLGRIDFRPWWNPFNDVDLRRCRADANPGTVFFEESDWFTVLPHGGNYDHLGVAPDLAGCD